MIRGNNFGDEVLDILLRIRAEETVHIHASDRHTQHAVHGVVRLAVQRHGTNAAQALVPPLLRAVVRRPVQESREAQQRADGHPGLELLQTLRHVQGGKRLQPLRFAQDERP